MNTAASYPRLLGDVGGTNARFAWQAGPAAPLEHVDTYASSAYATLLDAARAYLSSHSRPAPAACCIGIATPVVGDQVRMTNHHWSFSISGLQRDLGVARLLVINDFTALAMSLPALPSSELLQVGGGQPVPGAPVALLGPGTGLGVSGLLPAPRHGGLVPISGEGGHVTLCAVNDEEEAVLRELRRRYGHASAERALSGPGLVNLYEALCVLRASAPQAKTAAEVTEAAIAGRDALCVRAVDMFFSLLGSVAGNLALTLGALGGVYVGGGIVPRLGQRIVGSGFRAAFEAKGRYQAYLSAIPVYVIDARQSPALVGASRALDEL